MANAPTPEERARELVEAFSDDIFLNSYGVFVEDRSRQTMRIHIADAIKEAVQEEREICAKVADAQALHARVCEGQLAGASVARETAEVIATIIRQRGKE